ncbi:Reverse transcriptase (RNA-dependent DNA polymerase) [Fragilaria crotonensis]|nr:Reverse transcriptase (RNA-dependent DNA polymerase) [Fragilaria crotonensis]
MCPRPPVQTPTAPPHYPHGCRRRSLSEPIPFPTRRFRHAQPDHRHRYRPSDYRTLTLEFGSYVQVFEDNSPSNTTRARSLGAITLTPTGNAQGDYYFLSLASGALISRHQWTAVPMTDATIARVEALAKHEGLPPLQARGLVVEWRPDMPIDDDEYDRDYDSDSDDDARDDPFPLDDYPAVDAAELADLLADAPPLPDAALRGSPRWCKERRTLTRTSISNSYLPGTPTMKTTTTWCSKTTTNERTPTTWMKTKERHCRTPTTWMKTRSATAGRPIRTRGRRQLG